MSDSPASPSPYEILGVAATVSQSELRRAYRRLLRETHPDTGGSPTKFQAVQRAWEKVGDPAARSSWDSGEFSPNRFASPSDAKSDRMKPDSSLRARSYGHPGGQARERFLGLMREWAGRGAELSDPYDPSLVRSAPREIRHLLADALAEEATARAVSGLGIGYTIWNGVEAAGGRIDHIVLGPAGLFAVMSEDWGSELRVVRGDLDGEGIPPGVEPFRTLARRTRALGRSLRVRFTHQLIVVPDECLAEPMVTIGRKSDSAAVRLSVLPNVLRNGIGRGERLSIESVFEVRTRLQHSIRFV